MIQREKDLESEKADLLARVRKGNPAVTTVYLVAVEPSHPRLQKWYVAAYGSEEQAWVRAYEESQLFASCPPNWVNVTVEKIDLEPAKAIPIPLPLSTLPRMVAVA